MKDLGLFGLDLVQLGNRLRIGSGVLNNVGFIKCFRIWND